MVTIIQYILIPIFALIPTGIWLAFFLQADKEKPEPRNKILLSFLAGIVVTAPTFLIEYLILKTKLPQLSYVLFLLAISLTEEVAKFLATVLVNKKNIYFDEPLDAVIYLITTSLGFATVENLLLVIPSFNSYYPFYMSTFLDILNTITRRFIGATLLHALASAILGYYWALYHFKKEHRKLIIGFGIAILAHFIFNIIIAKNNTFSLSILFLAVMAFFVITDIEKLKKESK